MADMPKLQSASLFLEWFSISSPKTRTAVQVWAAYSPVKNSVQEALAKQRDNSPTHSATSGELDMYNMNSRLLMLAGVAVQSGVPVTFNGLHMTLAPRVVLSPEFSSRFADLRVRLKLWMCVCP